MEGEGGGVLEVLLASPLPLLLRHTLDEGSERVYSAAVRCLHALLVPPPLEEVSGTEVGGGEGSEGAAPLTAETTG